MSREKREPMKAKDVRIGMTVLYASRRYVVWSVAPASQTFWLVPEGESTSNAREVHVRDMERTERRFA